MTNKQLHELLPAPSPADDDFLFVSTGENLARRLAVNQLPFRASAQTQSRPMSERLAERVSVKDFGAVGDGIADDTAAFQAASDAAFSIDVPDGRYRLTSPINVLPKRQWFGSGRDVCEILAEGNLAFIFQRNRDASKIDTSSADDWNRSSIEHMTIRMSKGGLRVYGHEFRLNNINFFGGDATSQADLDGWCIDMVDSNECHISDVNAGYGGGPFHAMNANGLRYRAITTGVNYGDSLIKEVSVKLNRENTVAILIDGHAADETKVVNNMVLMRLQVNAPQGGAGTTPLAGTTGIKLWNGSRICQIDCDIEVLDVAFEEYSTRAGGQSGACLGNTYVGCIAHFSNTNYQDSNGTFTRSVIQRNFIGCDNVAPIKTGSFSGDGGRCQDGDAFLHGAWLFNTFSEASIQLRSREKDVLLVTGDHKGDDQLDSDGHPNQSKPYHGLLVDIGSPQAAKITRPVSFGDPSPDNASEQLLDVRLELGNGEGDARGELSRVQINDPLVLRPRTTEPLRSMNGMLHYATSADALPATGDWYFGPGIYCRLNDGEYPPVAVQRGSVAQRERNGDFTVSSADFGKVIRVNNGATRTVTIPAGIVPAGQGGRKLWIIRQGSGDVEFKAQGGMTIRSTDGKTKIARQYQIVELLITQDDETYLNHIVGEASDPYERNLHWTSGNLTLTSFHIGKLVRVSSANETTITIPSGLVPDGLEAVNVRVMKMSAGNIGIGGGSGMTLVSPSGGSSYSLTQTGKIIDLTITSASDNFQPDHIYIQD